VEGGGGDGVKEGLVAAGERGEVGWRVRQRRRGEAELCGGRLNNTGFWLSFDTTARASEAQWHTLLSVLDLECDVCVWGNHGGDELVERGARWVNKPKRASKTCPLPGRGPSF
jgi:hypothetical protein